MFGLRPGLVGKLGRIGGVPPLGAPSFSTDFTLGVLSGSLTFTRSTTALYCNSSGDLTSAAINTPRFDYDPIALTARGYLAELARTNTCIRSNDIGDAAWTKTSLTTTSAFGTAPNAASESTRCVVPAAASNHLAASTTFAATSGQSYAFSIFAKPNGYNFIRLSFGGAGAAASNWTFFNLSTGAVATSAVNTASFVTAYKNGWYRCTIVGTAAASAALSGDVYAQSADNQFVWTGDAASSVLLWGAQIENAAFPTSHIPTLGVAVLRNIESMTLASPAGLGSMVGTLYVSAMAQFNRSLNSTLLSLQGAGGKTAIILGSGNTVSVFDATSGMNTSIGAEPVNSSIYKAAFSYKPGRQFGCLNGGTVITNTLAPLTSTQTALNIGHALTTQQPCSWIRSVAYYTRAATSGQVKAMST